MEPVTEDTEGRRGAREAKVTERVEGCYESLEIPFGVVYKWYPGSVLVECGCGKQLALTCSLATCSECGVDHGSIVRAGLAGECSEDEAFHPWRYAGNREGYGLPF